MVLAVVLAGLVPGHAQKRNPVGKAESQARSAEVRCRDAQDCPDGVGLWASVVGRSVSQCTGFLIDSIHAVTDRHCIPPDLQTTGASCRGRAWLHLPSASGVRGEVCECDRVEILSRTDSRVGDPDYAVVRLLHPTRRTPLSVDRGPLGDLDTVEVVRVRPMDVEAALREVPVGVLARQTCLVSRRTRSFADRDQAIDVLDPLSRRVPLVECPAEGGNSGSPVLVRRPDGSRVVRALLDRTVDLAPVENWARKGGIRLLDSSLVPMAWAGNFACLPLPGDAPDWRPPLACLVDSSLEALAVEKSRWKAEVDGALDGKALEWSRGRGIRFSGGIFRPQEWPDLVKLLGSDRDRPDAFVVPVPQCLEAGAEVGKGIEEKGAVPVWDVVFGFDSRLRWNFRVGQRPEELTVRLGVRPGSKGARVSMEVPRAGSKPLVLWKKRLPRCPLEEGGGSEEVAGTVAVDSFPLSPSRDSRAVP